LRTILPGPPPSFLIGNLGYLAKQRKVFGFPSKVYDNLFKEYGDSYIFDLGPTPAVFTRDVDLIKWMYTNDPEKFSKLDFPFLVKDVIGQSIVFTDGKAWYRKRNLMRNAFKKTALESFLPAFQACAKELITVWEQCEKENKEIDVVEYLSRLTLDVIGRVGFGYDFQAQLQPGKNQSYLAWNDVSQGIVDCAENPFYAVIGPERFKKYTFAGKRYLKAESRLVGTVRDLVSNRVKNNEKHHRDLLQYCIESAGDNHDEEKYTQNELIQEIMLFFVAGHDTTANLIAFTLYCIAKNPEIRTKLLEELKEAGVRADTVPSWHVINNLPYMVQVLKESLRLYPVATFTARKLIKEEKYKDLTFPAGTHFFPQMWAVHHDSRHYPCEDVNQFNPDHFSPKKMKSRHPYAWIPFAGGIRNCIGMQFAMIEARTVLAEILPKFEFTVTSEPKLLERLVFTSQNLKMRFKKKNPLATPVFIIVRLCSGGEPDSTFSLIHCLIIDVYLHCFFTLVIYNFYLLKKI